MVLILVLVLVLVVARPVLVNITGDLHWLSVPQRTKFR